MKKFLLTILVLVLLYLAYFFIHQWMDYNEFGIGKHKMTVPPCVDQNPLTPQCD